MVVGSCFTLLGCSVHTMYWGVKKNIGGGWGGGGLVKALSIGGERRGRRRGGCHFQICLSFHVV
jgi:hypothetical protein